MESDFPVWGVISDIRENFPSTCIVRPHRAYVSIRRHFGCATGCLIFGEFAFSLLATTRETARLDCWRAGNFGWNLCDVGLHIPARCFHAVALVVRRWEGSLVGFALDD